MMHLLLRRRSGSIKAKDEGKGTKRNENETKSESHIPKEAGES